MVGDHAGLAAGDALEEIAVRHEGDALLPRAVFRREMLVDIEIGPEEFAHAGQQFLLHGVGLLLRPAGELILVEQDLPSDNLVNPCVVDFQLAQFVGEFVLVAPGNEIGR